MELSVKKKQKGKSYESLYFITQQEGEIFDYEEYIGLQIDCAIIYNKINLINRIIKIS